MKPALAFLIVLAGPLAAQVPRAEAVDPALAPDAGNDFFLRGKNLYDTAQAAADPANKTDFFQRAAQIFNDYLTSFPNHPNAEMAWWYLGSPLEIIHAAVLGGARLRGVVEIFAAQEKII